MAKRKTPTFGFKNIPTFNRHLTQAEAARQAAKPCKFARLAPEFYEAPKNEK